MEKSGIRDLFSTRGRRGGVEEVAGTELEVHSKETARTNERSQNLTRMHTVITDYRSFSNMHNVFICCPTAILHAHSWSSVLEWGGYD